MTTQTALATSPATLASNQEEEVEEEKKNQQTRTTHALQVRFKGGGQACTTPRERGGQQPVQKDA